jgi:two-component system response regulator AtoC
VLITGESGTGKELLAKAIHHNSPRRGKPFVAINCGAIPENLIESELFGHKKGSFTDATRDKKGLFEEANGGTIFLDEIGELPIHLQVKLLRTLQEQEIRRVGDEQPIALDVRVIAATLRNLEDDVAQGRFRDDLFYRLHVVSIHIPPLRERPEDIPVLVDHFMAKHNKRLGLAISKIYPEAMRCLVSAPWRGNVRELENCIERALVLTDSDGIDVESLAPQVRESGAAGLAESPLPPFDESNLSIKERTRVLEIDLITRALKKTRGNRTHAAKILEISHRALLYKLKEYGLGAVALERQG